ncbi:MAG: flagellar biosynthesis protein FlhA [Armatimonadota bacterium]|nr:flagellar biosynthesis protein FlhA [Armatimonadota bacterium]MDR5675708.1 flagellar biosynthesis protein FlhA [Armatimonadota bacterium]MDR7392297.1 flagellar biosynthesis protein FlhA [Armatimonadota bacterium]MDR7396668.1 flagellar biosynthesis protein FlhA [Armatimonadota bacterium]MDR7399087.1 flagellar biosynthesis protein FlhA [Armatimonadota bacterium]
MTLGRRLLQSSDLALAACLLLVTATLVVPLPTALVDVLLVANLALSVVVLLATAYVTDPLQLSVFPSLLLTAALGRLGLNVAMARLILTQGSAGSVVAAFGGLVVGGNLVVGLVLFVILLVVQFLVVTNGTSRMAEVAARFALDAMPGKQMSIDAELNAGALTEEAARERRRQVERQSDFFGAMDGASKFVRGDAIAGLLITAVNLLGGFGVGVSRGMSPAEAAGAFALQAVGAGLALQIPSLLMSAASGLILTRTAGADHLGADLVAQLTARWRPLVAAGAIVAVLGLFPGLPKVAFLLVGGLLAAAGWGLRTPPAPPEPAPPAPPAQDALQAAGEVDPISLEIGYGLVALVEPTQGGDLLNRIVALRKQLATSLGLVVPPVRVRDDPGLGAREYCIRIRGVEVARGEVVPSGLLAVRASPEAPELPGMRTTDPAFGTPAVWISQAERAVAEASGYTVVEPPVVVATHLHEVVRRYGWRLLSRQDVQEMLDRLRERQKTLVDELVPNVLSVGDVQRVLQLLLQEGVPIRDLVTILEILSDAGRTVKEPDRLVELVRRGLGRGLYQHLLDDQRRLNVLVLDPQAERLLLDGAQGRADVEVLQRLPQAAQAAWEAASRDAAHPVLLCSGSVRPAVRRLLEPVVPQLPVLAFEELEPNLAINRLGTVSVDAGPSV